MRQRRGTVAVFVMVAAVAAVALMAGQSAPTKVSLGAMTKEDADHMFRNAKPMRCVLRNFEDLPSRCH